MFVPRIWQREKASANSPHGGSVEAVGWGWSENSVEEAQSRAKQTAQRIVNWLQSGQHNTLDHYGYDQRLPREEVMEEYQDSAGKTQAFISRNAYGCLVLNTRDLMFIDVDVDVPAKKPPKSSPFSLLASLFGKSDLLKSDLLRGIDAVSQANPLDDALAKIRKTASSHPDLGFRVLRTFKGFRVIVINRPVLPDDPRAQQLLADFQSDPLYIRMCKNQQCFRARLTPKPWRCGMARPTVKYPFQSEAQESQYRAWEKQYLSAVKSYSTCDFVATIGPQEVAAELRELIAIHDQLAQTTVDAPLA